MAVMINGVAFSDEQAQALIEKTLVEKNDPASTTPTARPLHGLAHDGSNVYGAFTAAGVRPQMYSTLPRPRTLARLLGVLPSRYHEERIEVMTGVTQGSGSNATSFCDPNAPVAGRMKVAQQRYLPGYWYMKTNLNTIPYIGRLGTRAEVPREILNAGAAANPLIPDIMYTFNDTQSQLQNELYTLGVEIERALELTLITGDITQASANTERGFIREFNGLDQQIATGKTDAMSGLAAQGLDSYVLNFGAAINSNTPLDGSGRNFTETLSDTMFTVMDRAAQVGMDGTEWAIVMRREQFREAAKVVASQLPVSYVVDSSTAENVTRTGNEIMNNFMMMLRGQYLMTHQGDIPVVFSDGINRDQTTATTATSDIYIVPLSYNGRRLLTLEYFPMDNTYIREFTGFASADDYRVINNGLYLVASQRVAFCKEYLFASIMRLILDAPFLAARIDNVTYAFRSGEWTDAYPGLSAYRNGGASTRGTIF